MNLLGVFICEESPSRGAIIILYSGHLFRVGAMATYGKKKRTRWTSKILVFFTCQLVLIISFSQSLEVQLRLYKVRENKGLGLESGVDYAIYSKMEDLDGI